MALQIEVDNLTKDELLFELQARGLDINTSNTVDELKQQFKSAKGTSIDNTKANTFISDLSIDDEFQVCEGKLDAVLSADHSSSSCRRRCLSKLSHVILRLEKLLLINSEQRLKKIALVAKAYNAIETLKCNQAPGLSSHVTGMNVVESAPSIVCQRHTSQVLKWGLVYDGRDPVHDFVFRLQELKYSSEVSDSELLRNAVHLFSGEALMWFRTNKAHFNTFEDLVESLKDEFQPIEYERCLLNQIKARLQGKDESIRSYVNIMESLFLRLSVPITAAEQLDIIMTNMNPYFISRLALTEDNDCAVPVLVVVAPSGVKICDPEDESVRMYHALRRISFATCESARALFAFVAREPRAEPPAEPAPRHYCHAFRTETPEQADELNTLVGDAFRMAFASQLQPSAPLWSAELSGGECARAPDSLPGLTHHYPRSRDRSPSKCDNMGLQHEASPTSSEESNSPTEINCYRRLGERAPLMKRLAMGLSGALLQPSDDDSTPLVADTPTTPTNLPLCMNGGYINEASEADARSRETRESNRELTPRHDNDLEEFTKCNNIKNGSGSAGCSAATSSSSGASSCGGSHGSGNNNVPRAEPELRHAPWFQAGIPREIALEVLSNQPVGAFMVRCSTTQTGCFALSVRVPRDFQPSGIAHYLILRTPKGYKIKGFTKEFTSLSALVTHHSVMPELLPCPLRLARRPAAPRAHHAELESPRATTPRRHLPFRPQLDV